MKDKEIFSVMDAMDLTTLEIFQSRMEHRFLMRGMKEWDDDLKFSGYGREFSPVDLLTGNYRAIGTKELVAGFHEMGLGDYLSGIDQLLREGRHEGIEFFYHRKKIAKRFYSNHIITPDSFPIFDILPLWAARKRARLSDCISVTQ